MLFAYVGVKTTKASEEILGHQVPSGDAGVFVYSIDKNSGALNFIEKVPQEDPTYLVVSEKHGMLYAPSHASGFKDQPGARVIAYRLEPGTGMPIPANEYLLPLVYPVHVTLDREEQFLFLAYPTEGAVAVLPLNDDGTLAGRWSIEMLADQPVVKAPKVIKPNTPFPHGIPIDTTNRVVLVPDRNRDCVLVFYFDAKSGTLEPGNPPWVDSEDGAAPRHATYHPSGRSVYVINESTTGVSRFEFSEDRSTITLADTVLSVPADFQGKNRPAESVLLRSAEFLFVANRGENTVATFAVDPVTEQLTLLGSEPTQGETPRSLNLTLDEHFLYVTNEDSDTIVGFHVDASTGKLTPTRSKVSVHRPASIVFWDDGLES